MKVYIVQSKVFYQSNGIDYQTADALEPLTVLSSKKKAYAAMDDYERSYKKLGYIRKDKYNNLFPMEHFRMEHPQGYRVIIYLVESEVE